MKWRCKTRATPFFLPDM